MVRDAPLARLPSWQSSDPLAAGFEQAPVTVQVPAGRVSKSPTKNAVPSPLLVSVTVKFTLFPGTATPVDGITERVKSPEVATPCVETPSSVAVASASGVVASSVASTVASGVVSAGGADGSLVASTVGSGSVVGSVTGSVVGSVTGSVV